MSQIIPIGIGSPAEIPQLVLTGLSPAVLPPPPTPGSGGEFKVIGIGDSVATFDEFSSLILTDGVEFTLPARAVEITWQTIFGSVPSTVDIVLQVSLDGSNWATIDTTTNVNGEIRSKKTSARFVRGAMLNISEGIITTVLIRVTAIESWYDQ